MVFADENLLVDQEKKRKFYSFANSVTRVLDDVYDDLARILLC